MVEELRFSVWYVSPEKSANMWRFTLHDDVGDLQAEGRGIVFRGRNRTIKMPKIVNLRLLPLKGSILKQVEVEYEAYGSREIAYFVGQGVGQQSIASTLEMYHSLAAWHEKIANTVACPRCGAAVEKGNAFCGKCAAPINSTRPFVQVQKEVARPTQPDSPQVTTAPSTRSPQVIMEVPPPLKDDVYEEEDSDAQATDTFFEPAPRSTPKKGAAGAIAAVVVVIFIVAGIAYALSQSSGPGGLTGFRISGSGCWSGAFGNLGSTRSIDGCGSRDISFSCDGVLSGVAQKDDDGGWTLSLQVLSNGRVIESSSTSAAYGVASAAGSC